MLNVATGNIGAGNRVTLIWVSSMPGQSFKSNTLLRDPVYADIISRPAPLWRLSRDIVDNCYGLNVALIEHLLNMQSPYGPVPDRPGVVSIRPPPGCVPMAFPTLPVATLRGARDGGGLGAGRKEAAILLHTCDICGLYSGEIREIQGPRHNGTP